MTESGRRVLAVDDEMLILRGLKLVLREAGFEPVTAANATEALDLISLRPPDAAIVDLVLPDGARYHGALSRDFHGVALLDMLKQRLVGFEAIGVVHHRSPCFLQSIAPCPRSQPPFAKRNGVQKSVTIAALGCVN